MSVYSVHILKGKDGRRATVLTRRRLAEAVGIGSCAGLKNRLSGAPDTISLQCSLCVVQVLNEMDLFWLVGGQSRPCLGLLRLQTTLVTSLCCMC